MNKKTLIALGAGLMLSLAGSSVALAESHQTTDMHATPISQTEKATQIKNEGKCQCRAEKCTAEKCAAKKCTAKKCAAQHKTDHNSANKHDMNAHKTLENNDGSQ